MISMTVMTANPSAASPWTTAIYAAVATAVAAIATALLFQAEILVLYLLAFLLIGVGPVVGYQLATGQLGADWKPIVGGFLGFILLILGFLLWPILVGAMSKTQSVGRLFVASIVGIILGVVVFLVIATTPMGQGTAWVAFAFTLLWAVWGGACGAAMAAWSQPQG